jgi:hypothetical protein
MAVQGVALSVKLFTGTSTFLELNNKVSYRIADGSFDQQAVQHRRKTAQSPFTEGEYVVSSLRGNVTEQFGVYVSGATQYDARVAVKALQDALEQPTFKVVRTIDNAQSTWSCYSSDYTMQSNRPLLVAKLVLVQVSLLRDPVETLASV